MDFFEETTVLESAKNIFTHLTHQNFPSLLKINLFLFTKILNKIYTNTSRTDLAVRNLLLFLFHLKHYLPIRASCILFGIEKSQFQDVFHQQLDLVYSLLPKFIKIDNRKIGNDECKQDFPDTMIVVDSTEVLLESNKKTHFSGKKKNFTLKYQTVVGAITGEILSIHGPEDGPTSDAKIYEISGLRKFLEEEDEFCLADKGYVGCSRAIHPIKKRKSSMTSQTITFTNEQIKFNKRVSHYRIIVENVNSFIKDWGILSHVYRGDPEKHYKIFSCCCLLINWSNKY